MPFKVIGKNPTTKTVTFRDRTIHIFHMFIKNELKDYKRVDLLYDSEAHLFAIKANNSGNYGIGMDGQVSCRRIPSEITKGTYRAEWIEEKKLIMVYLDDLILPNSEMSTRESP